MPRDVLVDGRTLYVGSPARAGVDADGDGGLYYRDTRHLSALSTALAGTDLVPVGRDLQASNRRTVTSAALDATVNRVDEDQQKHTGLVCRQCQVVREGDGLRGTVTVDNHASASYFGTLHVSYDVDFADVFEVRGFASAGDRDITTTVTDSAVSFTYTYESADGTPVTRTTTISFDRHPERLTADEAMFNIAAKSQGRAAVSYTVVPATQYGTEQRTAGDGPRTGPTDLAGRAPSDAFAGDRSTPLDPPVIETGRRDYDRVFERAVDDLSGLTTQTDYGPVPLAGTPWFATVFGRDALIAAYQTLPIAPELAAGTLRYLAAHQGTDVDEDREEAPGKIFHEMRDGELAHRERVPHTPYYGSVDATPLWVILLAEYYRWTGADGLVVDLSDSLDGALSWIEAARTTGDHEFLAYEASPGVGLRHKAWRDTPGAVQFPDGDVADSPIASVEVQGYVYRTLRDAADLYEEVFDDRSRAGTLRTRAESFASAFESTFWLPEREYYAVARAGDGSVVPTATSNPAHCLWSGIVPDARAPAVAETLRSEALSTPWGLRTMSADAAGYSPVSYHLGSVWPHDTSLAALGLASYGFESDAERLAQSVLEACTYFDEQRIPELFCGFDDGRPKEYPSSCVPQAWSAGAPYALLRAVFGLEPADAGVVVGWTPDCIAPEAIEPIRNRWTD